MQLYSLTWVLSVSLNTPYKQIEEVRAEAARVIDERGKAYKQDIINKEIELNNKNDIELQKKDLEIQRLKIIDKEQITLKSK